MTVFEKLNITVMVKNHNLAKAIMDATWGKLRLYTAYKVERRGGQVIVVNPRGTSQKCSRCGADTEEKLDLSVRMFECRSCGLVLGRDLNAAINILKLGLEQAHAETEPLLVQQRISKFQSRKQEAHVLRRGWFTTSQTTNNITAPKITPVKSLAFPVIGSESRRNPSVREVKLTTVPRTTSNTNAQSQTIHSLLKWSHCFAFVQLANQRDYTRSIIFQLGTEKINLFSSKQT